MHSGSGVNVGVIEALKDKYNKPIELVHRLDRATSGCLILAKKRSVLKDLHQQLVKHQMEKRYIAFVKNSWSKNTIQSMRRFFKTLGIAWLMLKERSQLVFFTQ